MTDFQGSADPHVTAIRLLRATRSLSLGTFGPEGAWVAPLLFTTEPDFTLLIELESGGHHGLNLRINPTVAGAIFDPARSPHHADSVHFTGNAMPVAADQVLATLDRYHRGSVHDGERLLWMPRAQDYSGTGPKRLFRIALRTAFKMDLESTAPDRRLTLDLARLKTIYGEAVS